MERTMKLIRIFTFQYGEIKRTKNPAEAGLIILFTFQYGEIKSNSDGGDAY